jgi:hypothetical protein
MEEIPIPSFGYPIHYKFIFKSDSNSKTYLFSIDDALITQGKDCFSGGKKRTVIDLADSLVALTFSQVKSGCRGMAEYMTTNW